MPLFLPRYFATRPFVYSFDAYQRPGDQLDVIQQLVPELVGCLDAFDFIENGGKLIPQRLVYSWIALDHDIPVQAFPVAILLLR